MKLRGNLIQLPTLELGEDLNTRYVEVNYWGTIEREKEIKTSNICCVCEKNMWIRDYPEHSTLIEGFKVADPRAYINGTPDYLNISNCLLECHYDCQLELKTKLDNGTFVKR
jgi:hypothetical protein